ncbi:ComEC/Rec2 family competence protein [Microbacterium sp. Marseille-Q6965]|uniref:ComEC/Rec2 family competence protein n=1 Tax=Microbacterium sp. Marseille-Q6965 TaxID=2965072 RepID=UPI0021B83287|nr:ComEC/Rec2 family competence protein [Microbacterium sp. Marseille-Q6965]
MSAPSPGGARPRRADLRLLPVACTAWAGAFGAVMLPAVAWAIAAAALAAAATAVALAIGRPRLRAGLTLAAVAVAAGGGAALHAATAVPARTAAAEHAAAGEVQALVEITTKVEPHGPRLWFGGVARALESAERTASPPVPVRVAVDRGHDAFDRLDLGSVVDVRGGAEVGGPDSAEALVIFARVASPVRDPPHVLGIAAWLRDSFVDRAARLPGGGGELLPGIAVGDTRAVTADLDAAMKSSSLSHLTAVSGANCALVVGVAFAVAAWCGAGRRTRIGVALVVLAGFVVLVTPEPSVIRAASMAAIAMLALLLGRAGGGVAVLAGAVTVLLLADPWLATSYAFLLSAAATGALLLLAAPLADGLERWMPQPIALALAVPLSAQLVCGPIIVLFAPEVALYGVVANVLAGPAAPAATLLGTAACLLVFTPAIADALAWVAWLPASWVAATAEMVSALPRATVAWWGGAVGFGALALVGGCVTVLVLRPRDGPGALAARRSSAAVLALTVGLMAAGGAVAGPVLGPLTAPRDWLIAACDVGQGDAVLVRSGDAIALIDTGPDPEPLGACLDRLGAGRIDLLVLTHFDADHVGGVAAVADRVALVMHGPPDAEVPATWAALDGTERVQVEAGMQGPLGDARWRVLWPAPRSSAFPPGNDASVVVEFTGGGLPRSIFLGDLSAEAQTAMDAHSRPAGPYEVVKVAHHGSADQDHALYRQLDPTLALVTVGENDYGHPRASILDELRATGSALGRTDEDGLILVGRDGETLTVWRERGG